MYQLQSIIMPIRRTKKVWKHTMTQLNTYSTFCTSIRQHKDIEITIIRL